MEGELKQVAITFLKGSKRAVASAFLTYLGLGGGPLAKQAMPPLDDILSWASGGVALLGFAGLVWAGVAAFFAAKS